MKLASKKTALLLAAMMTASAALASCGGSGSTSSTSTGSSSKTDASTGGSSTVTETGNIPDSATVTLMMPSFGKLPNETPVGEAWEEKMRELTGCDITFEWNYIPYAEYTEKTNVALASADLPDLFRVMSKSSMVPYYDQDIFLELSGYTDLMPNFMYYVSTIPYGEIKACDADGNMWGFTNVENPRLEQGIGIYTTTAYRYDTFQELGIEIPTTTDEFYEAAKKIKEAYPDTYPVDRGWATFETYAYKTSDDIFWNGEAYEYGPVSDNYKAMLTFLNKLYSEGLLDPECFTEDSDMHTTKALTGKTFMQMGEWFSQAQTWNNNAESDAYWVMALAPSDPAIGTGWQQVTNVNEPNFTGETMCINPEAEYPELLVTLCDLQYSDEVIELVTWGIEDLSFVRKDDGTPTFVDSTKNAENPWSENDQYGNRASASCRPGLQLAADTRAYIDFAADDPCYIDGEIVNKPWETAFPNYSWPDSELIPPSDFAPPITFTTDESQNNSTIMTAVQTMVDEYKLKFIKGEESLDNWDSYVQAVTNMGFQEVIDLYNEKAAAIVE